MFLACDLIALFNRCFADSHGVKLVGGSDEPLYLPALQAYPGLSAVDVHRLFFRADYYASALHEISHWCIAGEARRQQIDFGYWYAPEGRDAMRQDQFEAVEIKPQAIEYLFSLAAGFPFQVSLDNFSSADRHEAEVQFYQRVCAQAQQYLAGSLPRRAATFRDALLERYNGVTTLPLNHTRYGAVVPLEAAAVECKPLAASGVTPCR